MKDQRKTVRSLYIQSYKNNRMIEYPSLEEQQDMQYWDAVNGTTNWKDAIAKVKSDNPKE